MHRLIAVLLIAVVAACQQGQPDSTQPAGKEVRILRDNYGVPHVYADSIHGLYYGYGYAVAQDRLFQMEMARRSTQGIVAEVLGPEFVDFDKNVRQHFDPASIKKQLAQLEGRDRDVFEGFAAGMNAWIDETAKRPDDLLPRQFSDNDFAPSQWTAYDVAMIFVGTMANRYGDFNTELDNVRILSTLQQLHGADQARALFDLLNPRYTDNAATTIPREDWHVSVPDSIGEKAINEPRADLERVAVNGPVISGMSNCWVLGKDKVSGANAVLVNGPQFGWFSPAYVYSVGLHGAGIDVVGNTPFAYPMIMFGHNRTITWGSTWGAGDIVDIFAEQLHPDDPATYLYKGDYVDLQHRVERIAVRGADDITLDVYRSVHGPIVHIDEAAGIAYAKHRAWDGQELDTLLAWLYATWASDHDQWQAEAEKSAINVNMYYADVWGNIGYFFGGKYPRRVAGHDNRFPATGDGSMDWQGRMPITQANPHILNPSTGYLANWNNKPGQGVMNPDFFFYSWSEADRVDFLQGVFSEDRQFTADEAWQVIESSSYVDLHAPYLLPLVEKAAHASDNDRLVAANLVLQRWDLQSRDDDADGFYDGAATAIFRSLVEALIQVVLKDDLGDALAPFAATGYPTAQLPTAAGTNIQPGMKAIIESLNGGGSYDLLNGRSAESAMAEALSLALDNLAAGQGDDIASYKLPVAPRPFSMRNFLGIPQAAATEEKLAPLEQNRGTENNLMIMNEGAIVAWEVTPPGQSGFVAPDGSTNAHYDDQMDMYVDFEKKRMWFYEDDVKANAVSETVLAY